MRAFQQVEAAGFGERLDRGLRERKDSKLSLGLSIWWLKSSGGEIHYFSGVGDWVRGLGLKPGACDVRDDHREMGWELFLYRSGIWRRF